MKTSVALLLLTVVTFAQEHAPTVQQCQADQRLWFDQLSKESADVSRLSIQQLNTRSKEMTDCGTIDEDHLAAYDRTAAEFHFAIESRLTNFLTRHKLMAQFLNEDAVGKR